MTSDEVLSHHAIDRRSEVNTEKSNVSETEAIIGKSGCFHQENLCRHALTKCANRNKALCQLCNKEYVYLGATSNLSVHLQHYNKDKF